jgi:hypothetical protein
LEGEEFAIRQVQRQKLKENLAKVMEISGAEHTLNVEEKKDLDYK